MTELLRDRLLELGVDSDDWTNVVDLASAGATWVAWRSGPVEDWHAVPWCRIGTPELMRASALLTRATNDVIRAHVLRSAGPRAARHHLAAGAHELFASVGQVINDAGRRLPDGRTVANLALSAGDVCEFVGHVRSAVRRWTVLAVKHGLVPVLFMLACTAGWHAHHWWGTPGGRPGRRSFFVVWTTRTGGAIHNVLSRPSCTRTTRRS